MDRTDNSQGAVIRFLDDPATHGTHEVRRIETHANVVFLAGEIALKVKRAVRFPFLDYSTLAKRKVACESELEVNRAFAPELYLRVVPITRTANGALALHGEGEAIEWAVEMRRFDESRTLDHIAEVRGIDDDLARALAAMVSAMHEVAPVVEPGPWLSAIEGFIDQNAEAFCEDRELFDAVRAANLDGAVRAACARLRPLLLRRGKRGLTRRGHGDLHLANIVLLHDRPVPFDAIEFDPNVAAGDVLYDLAFLLMDLLNRGLSRAANTVLNGYCASAAAEDLDGLAALPFFLSMRAAIRAKVTAARRQFSDPGRHSKLAEEAAAYFRLACGLISPMPPTLIAVGGMSGTGKSLLARALAPFVGPAPGALMLRSDVERKKLFGVAETDKLPADGLRDRAGHGDLRTAVPQGRNRCGRAALGDRRCGVCQARRARQGCWNCGGSWRCISRLVPRGRPEDQDRTRRSTRGRCI